MPDRMGYSVIFMFKRSYFFSWAVWFPFPWSSWCSLSELMMWVKSNSTWQNKSEDVKSSLFPVSHVSKQMSFHPIEKLFSTGFRLLDLVKLCGFLHMEIVLGFVCVGIYVLLFCLWSLRWYIKKGLFSAANSLFPALPLKLYVKSWDQAEGQYLKGVLLCAGFLWC